MAIKLDLKDRKILYELDLNSRQSFSSIAKKVGLSKNSVIQRVEFLKKEGAIKNFHAWVDFSKLGYMQFRFYFDLKHTTPKKEGEIVDFLKTKKIITWAGQMDGQYNLGAIVVTNNIHEVHVLWDEIMKKYVNYFGARLFTIIASNEYYYKAYLRGNEKNRLSKCVTSSLSNEKLSALDLGVLKMLSADARAPVIQIADKLKVTPKTVIEHIRSLEKRKIIVGYSTVLDLEKIGYQNFKVSFILFGLTPEKIKAFQDYAMANPNIIYDEEVVGGDDYEIEIQTENISEMRKIIEDMKSKFPKIIHEYKILHVFKEHKHIGFPEKI